MRMATQLSKEDLTKRLENGYWLLALRFLFQAPELKAFVIDGLLDLLARELMGWIPVGGYRADRMPGSKLTRQTASSQISSECPQVHVRPGFEDKNPHSYPF